MTNTELLHIVKKIAQYRKNQCWLCQKMELALDQIVMELIRREANGMDNNTDSDCIGDDGGSVPETIEKVWYPDSFINCGLQEEEIQGDGSTSTGCSA